MAANIVVDGLVLNYSRPILASSSSTVTPTVRYSPGRARTDDEGRGIQRNVRTRARSVPRAGRSSTSTSSPPPSSCATAYGTRTRQQQQRDSILSQQSSLYPPSTVTTTSAFSGPETPPEHQSGLDLALLDVDDVSYRLKLLVKNNYFLPPPHVKPTPDQLSALPTTPLKSPTIRTFFRQAKSPKTPQSQQQQQQQPPVPQVPVYTPRISTRPQNRVVVIRETIPELIPEPLPLSEEYTNPVETFVDPTDDVDGALQVVEPTPKPSNQATDNGTGDDWRKDLLAQAVGLSFVNPPPRKQSLPPEPQQPAALGQPIVANVISSRQSEQSLPKPPSIMRPLVTPSSALKPPPRPPRDRTRRADESPINSSPSSPNDSIQNHDEGQQQQQQQQQAQQPEPIRPSFTQSPRPSFSQSIPYAPSPSFGQPASPPARFSGATDHTQSTATLHFSDHEHVGGARDLYTASRPSFSASSMHYSEPGRPSMAESRVSHYSATFGDRQDRQSRASARTSDVTTPNSRRSSLAYLRDTTRSRSLSPSRMTPTASTFEPPPVPPLPTSTVPANSETDASTVIYVHSTGALSNTALDASAAAAATRLDPKRGITNVPPSPSSPRFFGLKSPKATLGAATVDVDILLKDIPDEQEQEQEQHESNSVEAWQLLQVNQEAARKFDGMVEQHIESEKDRFKRIASRGKPSGTD